MKKLKEYYEFVKTNFPEKGTEFCKNELNLTNQQIRYITRKLGLKTAVKQNNFKRGKRFPKKAEEYSVNYEHFCNIDTPIKAYLYGLLWADGHIIFSDNSGIKKDTITLTSTYPDADKFISYFNSTGKWGVYEYKPKQKTWKTRVTIETNNYFVAKYLHDNDYTNRLNGANKILSKIPENLQCYWFRGLIDGDGCFYIHKKRGIYNFSIASSLEQNWDFCETLANKFGLKYKIERTESKRGNYSKFIIMGKSRIQKLGNFIYENYDNDPIGLSRKWKKWKEIDLLCAKWVMSDAQ